VANFIISFRIKQDEDYQNRYTSFVTAVHAAGGGMGAVWEETSSFFALRANHTAASLCNHLYVSSGFNATKDEMLVVDLSAREMATKGPLKYLSTLEACLGF
jgi:hypothetical protein